MTNLDRSPAYSQLWGIVDGAVSDALNSHGDYLTPKGRKSARVSIVKRVTGTVLGFAEQSAKGRVAPAAKEARGSLPEPPATGSCIVPDAAGGGILRHPHPDPHCRIGKWYPKKRSRYRAAQMFPIKTAQLMREIGRHRKEAGE